MKRAVRSYPRTFWILVGAIAVAACSGMALQAATIPFVALFMPAVFLITTLCEVATTVLLTLILQQSRRAELQPLIVLFLASALLDAAVLLTIRLPGQSTSLIVPGNTATPWLFVGVHIALSLCAVGYAVGRSAQLTLSAGATRSALRIWFPAWTAALLLAIVVLVALCVPHGVALNHERTEGAERGALFVLELVVSCVAIALFVRFLDQTVLDWIDLSVLLTMIAGVAGLGLTALPLPRYAPPWLIAELLYGVSATFVLIAAIRDLLIRLGESLRIEADALQLRADAFERNVIVETSMLKSRFVAMVSHELRTPLGGIIGMAELLEREPLPERAARFTAAIHTSAVGLHRIVDDLLDFSRAESGRIELEDEPFDVAKLLDDVSVLFREQARKRGVALETFVDPTLPRLIRGDATRVKQVVQNLVSNALRFTSEGSVRIECAPPLGRERAPMMQFSVHDTGKGIAPEAIDRIFDAFVQEDASTARRFGGTGLGLSIAKHLVELMGGRLMVSSVVNSGTTFAFTLPIRVADAANVDTVPAVAGGTARDSRPERVLVADDNPINQMLLATQLEHLGLHADLVADGEAAVAAASTQPYDLIFMDCQMPGIDGFEATRRIRESRYADVPIVAVTAHVLPGYRETCLAAGMNDYLAKPALIGPLTELVERWLPEHALRAADASPPATPDLGLTLQPMRERLDVIFHGDRARIDRVIAMSLHALVDGANELQPPLTARDMAAAGKIAHRLKGVALEIGGLAIADLAQAIEQAIRERDWAAAEAGRERLSAAIEALRQTERVPS
jgi:signal transduction histidine kinase/CheY-like chemotaxis protein